MLKTLIFILSLLLSISIISPSLANNIVIIQHQVFRPFTEAEQSFTKHLPTYCKDDYQIESFNAKSDLKVLDKKIAEISSRKDIDLIFSIGTHSTKRVISTIKDKPIVFTITGDPVNSGIVKDWKSSGSNYTGIETPNYYKEVIKLTHQFIPFKKLGMIYLIGSPSHEAAIKQVTNLSKELDFKFYYTGFKLRNKNKVPYSKHIIRQNILRALNEVCPKVDVVFVQTSNTFTKHFDLFKYAFNKYKILGAGDTLNIKQGLAIGISKDAKRFGRQCAAYACKILNGTSPADLPMDRGVKLAVDINLTAFSLTKYTPSFNLISGADNVYQ